MDNKNDELEKDNLIEILTEELPSLRAKIGITQEELCDIVGISRQTYSSIETKKEKNVVEYLSVADTVFYT